MIELYLVARRTSDIEKALAFYALLGFEKSHEVRMGSRRVIYVGPKDRSWAFQLIADGGPPPVVDAGEFVGLETDDFEGELARLRSLGAMLDGPHTLPGGAHYAFLEDPDGHRIRLIEKTGFLRGGVHATKG